MRPVRVLVLSPIPEEGAGCRFRVCQYIPYLEARGFRVTLSPFFTPEFFRIIYQKGRYLRKTYLFAGQALRRVGLLLRKIDYDLFFIYREAFPIGPPLIELALSRIEGRALVYDFDDAIYLPNVSEANKFVGPLKWPRKVSRIIRASKAVVVGNEYLAQYARSYNKAVMVIPTCIDTNQFVPREEGGSKGELPVVGWIGSPTTVPYLLSLREVLRRVADSHSFILRVSGAAQEVEFQRPKVVNVPWSLHQEVSLFNTCDIGIYPLWDDAWTRGKCGFKAIQFMACGVPVVASAVGVNRDIIEDGVNGFLASTDVEWEEKLGWLLSDPRLREKLGQAGRRTVEERYSLAVHAPTLISVLNQAVGREPGKQ
jgi:glycosyltransferase involved in cell wall biosynthesis